MTSSNASAVNGPTQDGSSVAAPPVASPLPAPEPASVPEFSESVDPVTPTGLADVGWPTAPAPTTAVGLSPPVATAPSYAALLRSMQHVQLIHDARAHLHQPMPMPEQ